MDTYTIYKAAKNVLVGALKEHIKDKEYIWYMEEADFYANQVVEECLKNGLVYPFKDLNKPDQTYAVPMYGITHY